MSLDILRDRYAKVIQDLANNRNKEALVIAGDLTALIIDRNINDGTNKDGEKYDKYSKNPLPLFYFDEDNSNSPSKTKSFKEKAKKKEIIPSYENYRKFLGLPTTKRTHVVTGAMFKSIRPEIIQQTKTVTVVEIKADNRKDQDKLNWNSNKVGGSIISASDREKEIVNIANKERIRKSLRIRV